MAVSTDRRRGINSGAAIKVPVRAGTVSTNITLSGEQTIDGVALVDGDRCLVKNQTDATENGIYDVSTGTWRRSPDFDGPYDVVTGTLISITEGTNNASYMYKVTNTGDIDIGTTALTFSVAAIGGLGTTSDQIIHSTGLASATTETVRSRFNRVYYLTDFQGVDDTGATDSTAGMQAARDYLATLTYPVCLIVTEGIYSYTTSPNWAMDDFMMLGQGDVRFRYAGTANAFTLDADPTPSGDRVYNMHVGPFIIEAPNTALDGVYMRAIDNSKLSFTVRGCGTNLAGLRLVGCSSNDIDYACSSNEAGTIKQGYISGWYQGAKPRYGVYIDERSSTEESAYNTFINPIIEGVSVGAYFDNAVGNTFVSGAIGGCTIKGYETTANAYSNKMIGTDFVNNNNNSVILNGNSNVLLECDSTDLITIDNLSQNCRVIGGSHKSITTVFGAIRCTVADLLYDRYADTPAGTITNNASWQCYLRNCTTPPSNGEYIGAEGRAGHNVTLTRTVITPSSSPYVYTNNADYPVSLMVLNDGTVTRILFERSLVGAETGQTHGMWELSTQDGIRIEYTVAPTVILFTR